ncbi:mitochondrial 2-oxoglutarate/malate carrier protein-like [Venturia canescens]|uniref:mitochondrial 2-oxoglutarate/malate carrier protein-like n=1 Tax=Venturia canescens TaxID=32260 RepID=UPI001C9BEDE7|nr:mitochondrial 2-oxoglutarate/malate carrier protein-like [Venturia canescens]
MSREEDRPTSGGQQKSIKRATVPVLVKFLIGGLAGSTGQIATHPLDVIKICMHTTHAPFFLTTKDIFLCSGYRGFYVGLTAALLRQVTYSTTRLGIYGTMLDCLRERCGPLNYSTLIGLGTIAGVVGAWVGTPADLVMVRMITDAKNPLGKQRCYRNAVVGLSTIFKDEGTLRLWRGAVPTMTRAAIVNGVQLATYSRTKIHLKDTNLFAEGMILQFCASMISSMVTCVASMPVDTAKTEIQSWHSPKKPPGMWKVFVRMARTDGFFSLWRGLVPYYLRAGPNTAITMITMDQLGSLYTSVFTSINVS